MCSVPDQLTKVGLPDCEVATSWPAPLLDRWGSCERLRWIQISDLVGYPQDYGPLWALSALWVEEVHARQGAGRSLRTIESGLLIRCSGCSGPAELSVAGCLQLLYLGTRALRCLGVTTTPWWRQSRSRPAPFRRRGRAAVFSDPAPAST